MAEYFASIENQSFSGFSLSPLIGIKDNKIAKKIFAHRAA
jgi:hypothetical protein